MSVPHISGEPVFSRAEVLSIIAGLMLAMFLASLDQTIVATSLSSIARDLQGWQWMPWVVSAYLVTSTITTPIYGRLSDLYGRRPILLTAIGLFVVASVQCALAQTMPQLIAARAIQGVGGGGLRSVSLAAIADIIAPRDRGRYQGYFSANFAVSNALGPVLGGFFADTLSWHWIFWINLPLGLAAFLLSSRALARLRKPAGRRTIDWLGAFLILASTTPILIGVDNAERSGGWLTRGALGPIAVGLLVAAALILWERVAPEPMLPLRLFRNPVFSVAIAVITLISAVLVGLVILIPLNYQLVAGVQPEAAGARLIPFTLGTVAGSGMAGILVGRTGRYKLLLIIGTVGATAACAVTAAIGLGQSLLFDVLCTAFLGTALGFQLSPISVTIQNAVHWQDTGVGMSCLLFFRLIGGALGVALLSTILIGNLTSGALATPGHEVLGPSPGLALFHLEESRPQLTPELLAALSVTIRRAFARVFWAATVILALSVVATLFLREVPLRDR
ncbi:MAG TPA: MDR family MFS transporter [Stellaceae bacterium]|nr:MDR family MFS transporter [Stellaceae bacterium]